MKRIIVATFAASLLLLAGCIHVEHEHHEARRGPPPHAPAHGYRHHHHAVDLRYDAHLAVYVVIGHPDHFFHDGHYFRRVGPHWESCRSWKKADWRTVEIAAVPPGLAQHYKGNGPKHGKAQGKGKGHGPAKHDD